MNIACQFWPNSLRKYLNPAIQCSIGQADRLAKSMSFSKYMIARNTLVNEKICGSIGTPN
jgi:hypothetical protein